MSYQEYLTTIKDITKFFDNDECQKYSESYLIEKEELRNLLRPLIFECRTCGCVFEAGNTEYKHEYSQREMCGWYEVHCPTCHRTVTLSDKD